MSECKCTINISDPTEKDRFILVLTDKLEKAEAELAELRKALKAIKSWINSKSNNRDKHEAIRQAIEHAEQALRAGGEDAETKSKTD